MRLTFGLILWAGLVPGLPVTAALAQSAPADTIVITGDLPGHEREQAQSYLKALGIVVGEQQASRWFDPICPRAIGLSRENSAIVERQIREIIREVGAPLAKEGCTPNFAVSFTDGPERVVRRILKSGGVPNSVDARALEQTEAPVRWWYHTEFRTRDGTPAADLPNVGAAMEGNNVTMLPIGRLGNLSLYGSSLTSTQAVRAIRSATVVIDVRRAEGVRLKSIVDYATLVGLAEIKLRASPTGSILSLFRQDGERRLTRRDYAFLTALYRMPMDRQTDQQRRALLTAMTDAKSSN
ncbi:MAG TPA: hypothetical protein VJT70_09470 [Sphingomicrobium sp.]|nr:hypothetical protein [Sphingomicrobium sp.]